MLVYIGTAIVILGCVFQVIIFFRTKHFCTKECVLFRSDNNDRLKMPSLESYDNYCTNLEVSDVEARRIYEWFWQHFNRT